MTFINNIRKSYVPVVFILQLIIVPICIVVIGNYLYSLEFFSPIPYIAVMVIAAFFLSNFFIFSRTESQLKKLKVTLINKDFSPCNELEYFDLANGKYFGIDKENGRILTISLYDKDKPILTGYEFYDWAGYDIQGCNLTLNFNNISRPYFNINSNAKIKLFCRKLDVLLAPSFSPKIKINSSFNELVQKKTQPC
ncbi:hypothetical protein [Photorhabdus stackebrandtii]|uniref:Uncharacterized protein n=1 Tax=Photorhabdus stackebrandtii TaxID=1123042 RepID=A0A7X5QPK2_9GAMM|nr:hypothetical protein [Photorhabdus stackebrandtii]NHB98203.1 hypothetical protein [Photorhabdus stackebrandtii]